MKKNLELNDKSTKLLSAPWGELVGAVNSGNNLVKGIYRYFINNLADASTNIINEKLLLCGIWLLENNNLLFHRRASYRDYQKIAELLFNNLAKIKKLKKLELYYRFCLVAVYSDYFNSKLRAKNRYLKELEAGLEYFKIRYLKKIGLSYLPDYFLGLIHRSQYYLFIGDLVSNNLLLNRAGNLLLKHKRELSSNYQAFFYYHRAWAYYECHRYPQALAAINQGLLLKKQLTQEPIVLHSLNIKSAILFALGKTSQCLKLAQKVHEAAGKVFTRQNQDVLAESALNIAKCMYERGSNLVIAKKYASQALVKLNKLFMGKEVDISQAAANVLLGDIQQKLGNKKQAIGCYQAAYNTYRNNYKTNVANSSEYQALIAKLGIKL